jgi:hypothetical protein
MILLSTLELALDYLALNPGRYLFPIKALAKFPPLVQDNLAGNASNDPEQIRAWHKKWPGCNWGVAHRKSNLLVADVDTNAAKKKVGQQTYDLLDLEYGWPDTEITTTPSGGHHHIYEGPHIFALGKYGLGEDIDSPNYTLIAGCTFKDGTSYVGNGKVAVSTPQWIYDLIGRAKVRIASVDETVVDLDKPENVAWAKDYLRSDAEPSIEGKGGEHQTLKVAMSLRDNGISESLAVELMNDFYNVPGLCEPEWELEELTKKIQNAYAYANLSKAGGKTAEADFGDDDSDEIADSIKVHAKDPKKINSKENREQLKLDKEQAKKDEAEKETADAKQIEMTRKLAGMPAERVWTKPQVCERWVYIRALKLFLCRDDGNEEEARKVWPLDTFNNAYKYLAKKGKLSDELLSKKTGTIYRVDNLIYKPSQPEFTSLGYNLYRPSNIEPAPGDTSIWNEHMRYLFPNPEERKHVLNWVAWLLKNPGQKPKHMLLIQGHETGTGKSFIAEMLTAILGVYNVSMISQSELSGTFNRWAMNAKLLLIEELRSVDKTDVKNKLHPLITQERIPINDKGEKTFDINNCFGIFAMTNDDAALQIDNADRRYLVVRTDAKPRDHVSYGPDYDPLYYDKLYGLLKDPAKIGAVAHELLTRDLEGYSGLGRAPETAAKREMIEAGLSDLEHWMDEHRGEWPLNGKLLCLQDVIDVLPKRIESKTPRLTNAISSVLKHRFQGDRVANCRLSSGHRARIWAINGSPIFNMTGGVESVIAALYEKDKASAGKPVEGDAADEFGVGGDD